MDRKTALVVLRVAGYHSDKKTWVRTYIENRVSYKVATVEWQRGERMRADGITCTCQECKLDK